MKKNTILEAQFRRRVLRALRTRGISVVDLGAGTFDLFIDERTRTFLELKVASKNYKRWSKECGIDLSPQSQALRTMRKLPIVLCCQHDNEDACHVVFPKELKKLVKSRRKYSTILIGAKHLGNQLTFRKAIDALSRYSRKAS
jgi:hypothetical protein